MPFNYKFDKLLAVRERQKEEALDMYNQSVKRFEETANKLYEILKKKEDLESYQSERLVVGLPVLEIRHHQQFVHNLEKTIDHYQKMVINARNQMNYYQDKLMETNTEVKKFEKMKEKSKLQYMAAEKLSEGRQMDDISIQQFMNRVH
ncbi:flagellar protein FliJ [Cytobacillus horneckiae]|uniref:Flagellar FliJ protein n=1 Tax=Cytobacillus horneckiae TaxID=549687 RepID=A0A2N0ZM03_9BACI|nr:flagellar export protein FliJ [Cytobacillus horneckiae]NRG43416.1 flagellar biosynthesis chaperone FliJ [Bacillus sp. CRN 9]MBN6887165.1 flagellar biosynthesis chaperone FliJ [Cytobacillus horneckiae]MCM3178244.1 flagellar biosynthesis chaperone FliJ [Cytobacillus horneckiae]MEC1157016.1 flagellar export protein FliJ [Cytobacillus horneckiae]MED2939958.1 flagellar export protein FliJ [Cytobacillus horneckiae]